MKKYTVGFIFNPALDKVLLIQKERPDWQKGKLNGIGGKIEPNEKSVECMAREVKEESGLITHERDWVYLGDMRHAEWLVDVYSLIYRGNLSDAVTTSDEKVSWFEVRDLPRNTLSNLSWLIHLSLDKIRNNEFHQCIIHYK